LVKRLTFSTFTLDPDEACLYVGGGRISLSPKDCALLHHLASNVGRVVSHAELLRVVWGDTAVGPDVLKVRIARLRRLLGDEAGSPRFIVNAHGEGYRFLPQRDDPLITPLGPAPRSPGPVVGRAREIGVATTALFHAAQGQRQMLFVTGDAGMGKTTLIDHVIDRANPTIWVGRGQCIEHYGSGEPYLPVMEALSRLGRHADRWRLLQVLERYAPSWLLQLPTLLEPHGRDALQRCVIEPSRKRMLRELAEALEALDGIHIATSPPVLVLVLEDLHWADLSTLDLLQMLARRRERARLTVVGSYRRFEATATSRSLQDMVRELCGQGLALELSLGMLGESDVSRYLDECFQPNMFPASLAELIHRRTAGHPLFVNEIVRDLHARDVIVRGGSAWTFQGDVEAISALMPASIDELLAREREALTVADRRIMQAASVAGVEFAAAAVAAALETDATDVEERCLDLSRNQRFLRVAAAEEWPDGTQSMRFVFPHALHQERWQQGLSRQRGEQWHLRIAERLEAAYGARAPDIASELATHFEHGGDHPRAIAYHEHAAALATQRAANAEAKVHLDRALELLGKMPEASTRVQLELRLLVGLGTVSALAEGFTAADAGAAFQRAYEIYRSSRDTPELLDSMFGLCRTFWVRGELARARELSDDMQMLVRRGSDPVRALAAHAAHGTVLITQGEFQGAAAVLAEGYELARTHWHDTLSGVYAGDLEIICLSTLGNTLLVGGCPDRAAICMQDALRLGDERKHPVSAVCALYGAALFHQLRRNYLPALEYAERLGRLASQHQLAQYSFLADMHRGWALVANSRPDDGLALLNASAEAVRRSGALMYLPQVLGLLADALTMVGYHAAARQAVDEALAAASMNGASMHVAELHRLHAELLLYSQPPATTDAEVAFKRAIAIARHQQARLWQLRATLGLARLWRQQGDEGSARTLVSEIYESFTEGFDTIDLQAAQAFLG